MMKRTMKHWVPCWIPIIAYSVPESLARSAGHRMPKRNILDQDSSYLPTCRCGTARPLVGEPGMQGPCSWVAVPSVPDPAMIRCALSA